MTWIYSLKRRIYDHFEYLNVFLIVLFKLILKWILMDHEVWLKCKIKNVFYIPKITHKQDFHGINGLAKKSFLKIFYRQILFQKICQIVGSRICIPYKIILLKPQNFLHLRINKITFSQFLWSIFALCLESNVLYGATKIYASFNTSKIVKWKISVYANCPKII